MKLVQINTVNYGSTGRIMRGIDGVASKSITTFFSCASRKKNREQTFENQLLVGTEWGMYLHLLLGRITGLNGCFSHVGTFLFLKKLDKINPDVLHLHNLHNCYINLPMLLRWIKKRQIKVIWTLHDCWTFTGQCPYFDIINCEKWKTGCYACPQYRAYPQSYVDRTKTMYRLKKKWFTGVENLTIVTPSNWLADLVRESFLKEYPVKVIHNGIDLNVFRPIESDIKEKLGIENKYVLLGCASPWSNRKGLDVFIELSQKLDEMYQIVLVGLSKEQLEALPSNIIGIEKTSNVEELAKYYSMADIFINPTREDNFPTVNLEALACGTPVITFKTGGSPESLDVNCGMVTKENSVEGMIACIREMREKLPPLEACKGRAELFDKNEKFLEYMKLYEGVK